MNIIQSKLLSRYPEVRCGVSTRNGGASLPPFGMNLSFNVGDDIDHVNENRRRFFHEFGTNNEHVAFTKQVHGSEINFVDTPGFNDSCDALMTSTQGLFLAISVADCIPIFLFDTKLKCIAAVHSGWRGSKLQIIAKAVNEMKGEFNSDPENLIAFIGPSAGVCCYEVGEEVASQFDEQFVVRKAGSKPHIDLKRFNKHLLMKKSVSEQNIEVSEYCTICNPQIFHSYRRDKEKSGRMMGIIGMPSTSS